MNRAEQFLNKQQSYETTELRLPSGPVVVLRRPPLIAWAIAGTIPPFFTKDVREAWQRVKEHGAIEAGTSLEDMEPEALEDVMKMLRGLCIWSFVEPKLVEGATGEGEKDEIDPAYLEMEDWLFLWQWIMAGAPGISVPMANSPEGGEEAMTIDALRAFRDGEEGREPVRGRKDRRKVRGKTV